MQCKPSNPTLPPKAVVLQLTPLDYLCGFREYRFDFYLLDEIGGLLGLNHPVDQKVLFLAKGLTAVHLVNSNFLGFSGFMGCANRGRFFISRVTACPHCGNEDVVSFEEPQPPEVKQSFWDKLRGKQPPVPENLQDPVSSSFCYVLKKTFVLRKGKHRCPSCGDTGLEFFRTGFFD